MTDLKNVDISTVIMHPTTESEEEVRRSLHYFNVPNHLHDGLVRYFLQGIRPGVFLEATLKNDLREAVMRSVDPSVLGPLVLWLNSAVPSPSWGSPQAVERWIEAVERWIAREGER